MKDAPNAAEAPRPDCACDGRSSGDYFDQKVRGAADAPATLHDTTRALLELLGPAGGHTVLELGAGRGGLLVETLRQGASHVTGVDLSPASTEAARVRLQAAGLADRATLTVGDGATIPVAVHDWVVLDRVICCYPRADALVAIASRAARHRVAFAVPDSRGWRGYVARLALGLENVWHRLRRVSCRTFIHDVDRIEATLASAGFRRIRTAHRGLWYIAVFGPAE